MPKPSALSALSQVISCGALILLVTPLQAAGQGQESEKAQTEIVRPQYSFHHRRAFRFEGGAANARYRSAIDFALFAELSQVCRDSSLSWAQRFRSFQCTDRSDSG